MGTIWKKKKQRGRKKREKQLIGLTLTGLLMEGLRESSPSSGQFGDRLQAHEIDCREMGIVSLL
jgi:hypothetical protein